MSELQPAYTVVKRWSARNPNPQYFPRENKSHLQEVFLSPTPFLNRRLDNTEESHE